MSGASELGTLSHDDLVSLRLGRICLKKGGRLPRGPLAARAVRAGLLVDIAAAGGLSCAAAGQDIEIDARRTGFDPADRLTAAILLEPAHPLEWWLSRGPTSIADIGEVLAARGVWDVTQTFFHKRYRERDLASAQREMMRLRNAERGCPDSVSSAALTVLAGAAGLAEVALDTKLEEQLYTTCTSLRWIVVELVSYLKDARQKFAASAEISAHIGM